MDTRKTGIILAAGRGKRLKELSTDKPKPLVEVNGKSILSNLVEAMIDGNVQRIVLVVGYKAELIEEHLRKYTGAAEIIFVTNEIYDTTNNIYSLWLARKYLDDGFSLFEADVFIEPGIVSKLIQHPDDNVMVIDKYTDRMNGTVVAFDFDFSDKYKTVNFYKIGQSFYRHFFKDKLDAYIVNNDVSYYYEAIIKDGVDAGYPFYGLQTNPYKWWEIDTKEDLMIAENLFK